MDITETALPGVGLRHDFTTRAGRQLGVVTHRTGRRTCWSTTAATRTAARR